MRQVKGTARRSARHDRDWTKGSITRNLLLLSWPVLVVQIINMFGPFIDMIWIARLGVASIAGVGIAGMVVNLSNTPMMALQTGMRAIIARSIGGGDNETAVNAATQALVINIAYSTVTAVIGILFAEPILRMFGLAEDVIDLGTPYMRIQFVNTMTMSLQSCTIGTMQPSGDTVTPMKISTIFRVFHVALCPFLVFGWWIFPRLGVTGPAVTATISASLAGILGLWFLLSGRTRLQLTLGNWRPNVGIIWRMVKISIPNLFMHIQHHFVFLLVAWFIAPFGTLAVAAHTLWQNVEHAVLTVGTGVVTGSSVLGAQNLGANEPKRAEKSGWLGAGFTTAFMVVCLLSVLFWAERMVSLFSTEPSLVKMTSIFLRISAFGYIGYGLNQIFMSFLTGVGDTLAAFWGEFLPSWGLMLPLIYFLSRYTDFGVDGIRWTIMSRYVIAGVIFTVYFWLGKWKYKKM